MSTAHWREIASRRGKSLRVDPSSPPLALRLARDDTKRALVVAFAARLADELDVRKALRGGDGDGGIGQVTRILLRAVQIKPTGHHLLEGRSTLVPSTSLLRSDVDPAVLRLSGRPEGPGEATRDRREAA